MNNLKSQPSELDIRIGFHSGQQYMDLAEVAQIWRRVEDLGYDWISAFDHLRPEIGGPEGPCLDATVTLAVSGLATSTAAVALMVVPAHLHNPGPLAMRAVALSQALGGRFVLGLGAGGYDPGFADFGIAHPSVPERVAALDSMLPLVRKLIKGETVTSQGVYAMDSANIVPAEPQGVPLAVGASRPRMLSVAGRHADVWNTLVTDPVRYREQLARVRSAAVLAGRDPASVRPSLTFRTVIGNEAHISERRATIFRQQGPQAPDLAEHVSFGTSRDCIEALMPYLEAGCRDFILAVRPPLDWQTIEMVSTEVAPELRRGLSR